MKYDFDKIVDRHGTDCYKWDMIAKRKLPADTLPLWVADMDFETVPEVKERLKEVQTVVYTVTPCWVTAIIMH